MESKDKTSVLVAIILFCLFTTAFMPLYFKTLFVEDSGRLTIIGPGAAVVLAIALLYKKSWSRIALMIFNGLGAALLFAAAWQLGFRDPKVPGLFFLLLLQIISFIALGREELRNFVKVPLHQS